MTLRGDQLIRELLTDSGGFNGNALLQEYFAGLPLDTLRPLLSSGDPVVRRIAAWIASELGAQGKPLLNSVIPLVEDPDPHTRANALDMLAVCAEAEDAGVYIHLVRLLDDPHDYIRARVMFFISNAEPSQIEGALWSVKSDKPDEELHKAGLSQLVTAHLATMPDILSLIDSPERLLRKYGAILAWRCRDRFPELVSRLASSTDQDIRKFWEHRANGAGAWNQGDK